MPCHLLERCGIDDKDLGLLLTGVPDLDVSAWKAATIVEGHATFATDFGTDHGGGDHGGDRSVDNGGDNGVGGGGGAEAVAARFFACLRSCCSEERARVLQFATGLSRLPSGGFARLRPRFKLSVFGKGDPRSLPTAHTCFNALELPPYASEEALREKLLLAVSEGAGSFAFH